jgi:two-component system cell cycle response regulator DivK
MTRVLIVDDIALNRLLLERILQPRGFETLSADGGEAGVSIARTERPDIILMDIQMPDISGYDALQMLRKDESTKAIPVMAVTGNATENDMERLGNAGFNASLFKPFRIPDLLTLVSRLTGHTEPA